MSVEVTILDQTDYLDRTDAQKPVPRVLVTFQTEDGRVDSLSLPKAGLTEDRIKAAIRDRIKARAPAVTRRVTL